MKRFSCILFCGLLAGSAAASSPTAASTVLERSLAEYQERDAALGDFKAKYRYTMASFGAMAPGDKKQSATVTGDLVVARRGRYVRITFTESRPLITEGGEIVTDVGAQAFLYRDGKLHGYGPGPTYAVLDSESPSATIAPPMLLCPPLDTDLGYALYSRGLWTPEKLADFHRTETTAAEHRDPLVDFLVGQQTNVYGTWGNARYGTRYAYAPDTYALQSRSSGWDVRLANGQKYFLPTAGIEVKERRNGFASAFTANWYSRTETFANISKGATPEVAASAITEHGASLLRRAEFELISIEPLPAKEKVSVADSLGEIDSISLDINSTAKVKAFTYDKAAKTFTFGIRYDELTGKWVMLETPLVVTREGLKTVPADFPGRFRNIQ